MTTTIENETVTDPTMNRDIRVLLVDDHTILRQGLKRLLEAEPGVVVAGEAKDGREAVEKAREIAPDVILMDLAMPALNGLDATRRILKARPDARDREGARAQSHTRDPRSHARRSSRSRRRW